VRIRPLLLATWVTFGFGSLAVAQDVTRPMDLVGIWVGEADFLLPEGVTYQVHRFEFTAEADWFLRGQHSWSIPDQNLHSHDGKAHTHESTEPFLAVVGHDGRIWIVEHGDTTVFALNLIDGDTLELIALEGGDYPLVGRGVLIRE
jgi:hypothetical protein